MLPFSQKKREECSDLNFCNSGVLVKTSLEDSPCGLREVSSLLKHFWRKLNAKIELECNNCDFKFQNLK